MRDSGREKLYLEDLATALQEYHHVTRELAKLSDERRAKARLVRSLLSVLKHHAGEAGTMDLLERCQLGPLVRPFLTLDRQPAAGAPTRPDRRGRKVETPEAPTVLEKGTRVRMLTGNYGGFQGVVSSAQARPGKKGLDVTYFLNLESPRGDRQRTSVKHGTLNKSWVVL